MDRGIDGSSVADAENLKGGEVGEWHCISPHRTSSHTHTTNYMGGPKSKPLSRIIIISY